MKRGILKKCVGYTQWDELRFNDDYTEMNYRRDDVEREDDGSLGMIGCLSYCFPRRIPFQEAKKRLFGMAVFVITHKMNEKKYLVGMSEGQQTKWDEDTNWEKLLDNLYGWAMNGAVVEGKVIIEEVE